MQTIALLFITLTIEFWLEAALARLYNQSRRGLFRLFKRHHFSWWRYFIFFGVPFVTIMAFVFRYDRSLLFVLISFAIIGTLFEYLTGYTYHNLMGSRLWTYHRYSIGQGNYASWLAVPMWGIAGVFFWALMRLL